MRLGFFLSEALGSMRRNWVMAMAAVITVLISTAILGAVLVTRDNLNQGATSLKNRVMIEVFIKDTASPDAVQALERKIQGLPAVKSYKYISKEEALRRFRLRFGDKIVENLPINPLPASYEIQVKDATRSMPWRHSSSTIPRSTTIPVRTTESSTPRRRCARCWAPSTSSRRACG